MGVRRYGDGVTVRYGGVTVTLYLSPKLGNGIWGQVKCHRNIDRNIEQKKAAQ